MYVGKTRNISIEDAIRISSDFYKQKNYDACIDICQKIIAQQPNNHDVKYRLALCYIEKQMPDRAEPLIKQIIKIAPKNAPLQFNLGRIKALQGKVNDAIKAYKKTLTLDKQHTAAMNNIANLYDQIGNNTLAVDYFKKFLAINDDEYVVHNNIARVYKKNGDLGEALSHILKAIELQPNAFDPHYNAASIYYFLGSRKKYIDHYRIAYNLRPDNIDLAIEFHGALGKVCAWDEQEEVEKRIRTMIENTDGDYISPVMSDFHIYNNPQKRLEVTQQYTKLMTKAITENYPKFEHTKKRKRDNSKIRIGYISSDIKNHAVSYLMCGVFRCHNKDNFEVYLYALNGENDSSYRKEIAYYCNEFKDVSNISNIETARMIYNDRIDILIDLNGYTGAARPEALALKPAPIQVSYLGYIGTMGADFIDYVITDEIVTPPELQSAYQEKFIYMPDSYQANDNKLEISDEVITRVDENLPEDAFIFCSFNQTYKIEPVMFDAWMNILKRVSNSVLWLYRGSPNAEDTLAMDNLRAEAEKCGIDPSRLVFAPIAPLNRHLKRIGLADLALDTRLYNGGTVTSQTLWAGVPVLTLEGEEFSARMASSILNALELPELVKTNIQDFEDKAVEIAQNKTQLKKIKEKLKKNKTTTPLFNTELFTQNLELAYSKIWDNYCGGNEAKFFDLKN